MSISHSRRRIIDLEKKVAQLSQLIFGRDPLLQGTVYKSRTRCGKPQCKCATTDYRHEQWCFSFVEDGQSRTHTLPLEVRGEVKRMTAEYREFKKAERELRKAVEEIIAQCAKIRNTRCEAGRKRYLKLASHAPKGRGKRPAKKGMKS
ncbi:MAG TPA: hypothetical protein EYP19_06330 [Desulfobacterales bacterium]|nr:hypothetical protein [Desulfobacterales bacterium]